MRLWNGMLGDERGVTMVEFVVIAPLFFALFLAIIDMGLAFYWWKSAEKATQLGVRIAVVRDAAAPGVPTTNAKTATGVLGQPCRLIPSPCTGFAPVECMGGACTGAGYDMILARMQYLFPIIQEENVRIRYDYIGLGFAGGPAVPAVSVILTGVDYPFFMLGWIFMLFGGDRSGPDVLPDIRATLTAEDLSTTGP